MKRLGLAVAVLALPSLAHASVTVRRVGANVSVEAQAAPLSDVLAQLSQQLSIKVVYDGAPPRMLVNATVENRTPAEAVLSVLEGLGLNYLARMDVSGRRVEQLVVAGMAGPGPATPAAAAPPVRHEPVVAQDEEDADEEEEPAPEEPRPDRRALLPGNRPRPALPGGPAQGGMREAAPRAAPTPLPLSVPPTYPVSPFAPAAPAPPSVVQPPPPPEPDVEGEVDAEGAVLQ